MDAGQQLFTAIILAADREAENPVAKAAGVRCKSLAPVNGKPMVLRVLAALSASRSVNRKILCGPPKNIIDREPELSQYVAAGQADWMESQETPSLSTIHVIQKVPAETPVLLTTSDHALLSPKIVDHFCREAQRAGCDVVAAVAPYKTVTAAYPQTRRTAYRFKDGSYCSCNLFAFLTPLSRTVPSFWRKVEQQRKNPLKVISKLGWITVLRYMLRSLTLTDAVAQISKHLGCRAGIVVLPFPEAAIDVDSASDWHIVEQIAAQTSP